MSEIPISYNRTFQDGDAWSVQWNIQKGDYPIALRIIEFSPDGERRETIIHLTRHRATLLKLAIDEAIQL